MVHLMCITIDPSNRIGQLFTLSPLLPVLPSRPVKELLTEDSNDIFVLTKDLQSLKSLLHIVEILKYMLYTPDLTMFLFV